MQEKAGDKKQNSRKDSKRMSIPAARRVAVVFGFHCPSVFRACRSEPLADISSYSSERDKQKSWTPRWGSLAWVAACSRQWPEVYDLCHTFLHVARVTKPNLRPSENRVLFSHGRGFFDSRNVQKCATKSDTSGHCLACSNKLVFGRSAATFCNTYPFREPKVFMLCTFWDMMTRTRTCFLACETKFHGFHENLLQTKAAIIA